MTAASQQNGLSASHDATTQPVDVVTTPSDDLDVLRREVEAQKRANILIRAEIEKERNAREALQFQLLETNAEVVASWDRRKEMARVIGERDSELANLRAMQKEFTDALPELERLRVEVKEANERRKEMVAIINDRDGKVARLRESAEQNAAAIKERSARIAELREELTAANERRKEMAKLITERRVKIEELQKQLHARFAELAILQRHIADHTIAGQAKRAVGAAKQFGRKIF